MTNRKYIGNKIEELEALFTESKSELSILKALKNELLHRKTKRAKALMVEVKKALESFNSDVTGDPPTVSNPVLISTSPTRDLDKNETGSNGESGAADIDWDQVFAAGNAARSGAASHADRSKPIENRPEDVLDTWTIIEALSPQTFKKPNDLVIGQGSVVQLNSSELPWVRGERSRPNCKLFYTVYLGSLDLGASTDDLLKIYQDQREEIPNVAGQAALAAVIVDKKGLPLGMDGLAISSYGWAYSRALAGKLETLKYWDIVEEKLLEGLDKIFDRHDEDDNLLPVDWATINSASRWLVANCAIPTAIMSPPSFAIRRYQPFSKGSPEAPLLNSFYLQDLQRAKALVVANNAGLGLSRYLGIDEPDSRIDLLNDDEELAKVLEPKQVPLGRWPVKGRFPLVLLQQAAVNLAHCRLTDKGLFSVNGPPGTGKTTLLRDVVASVVVDRAIAMSRFDNPEKAFTKTSASFSSRSEKLHLYRLDDSLKGYEILVASSNNKAVENISKELPLDKAIADDIELNYFKPLCDDLLPEGEESWGLIATVLGNSNNKSNFVTKAWWERDSSLHSYFSSIAGSLAYQEDDNGDEIIPAIVEKGNPPANHREALDNWRNAREQFGRALANAQKIQAVAQDALDSGRLLEKVARQLPVLKRAHDTVNGAIESGKTAIASTKSKVEVQEQRQASKHAAVKAYAVTKPGFFARLFSWSKWKKWKLKRSDLARDYAEQLKISTAIASVLLDQQAEQQALFSQSEDLAEKKARLEAQYKLAREKIEKADGICQGRLVTDATIQAKHADKQMLAPVYSEQAHTYRDELFVAAMRLHKAFIDAAYSPIAQNFAAFMNVLSNKKLPRNGQHLLADVWSTGFILSPVYSTAFASINRMLGSLPSESIGWLLIDEAGQATPQQAVGAITRARRVMAVGDPLQIEPVVTTPPPLLEGISNYMGVNHADWVAPYASVQRVADRANKYGATINSGLTKLWIGSPLLVHRRCEDPMFAISNQMAYGGQMVKATVDGTSGMTDVLGSKTAWFDIQGSGNDHWCAEEGEFVAEKLLIAAEALGPDLDIFVISPFKRVAQNMRERLRKESGRLASYGISNPSSWISNSVGTVHTFQGKEADTVILLLGAPNPSQTGARNWAASSINLMNVAVSRSKRNFYVVGNKRLWGELGQMPLILREIRKFER